MQSRSELRDHWAPVRRPRVVHEQTDRRACPRLGTLSHNLDKGKLWDEIRRLCSHPIRHSERCPASVLPNALHSVERQEVHQRA